MLTQQLLPLKKYVTKTPIGSDKTDSVVGIEFENELPSHEVNEDIGEQGFPHYSNWKFHIENSLRHYGFEYVSKPLKYADYKKQVKGLFDNLRKKIGKTKLPFTNSIRTSVHVHFEVLNYTTLDVVNFACLYWIMEPFLQHFCGSHRQGNLFCVRLRDSGYTRAKLAEVLRNYTLLFDNDLISEHYRYGSVNFNSVSKFGTIEFRMMRGVSHEKPAYIWIDALEKIRRFALQFTNPQELKDWYLNKVSAADVPITVLGEELASTLTDYLPDGASVTQLIRDGYFSTLAVLNAQTDFSEELLQTEKKQIEEIEKAKKEWHEKQKLKMMLKPNTSYFEETTSSVNPTAYVTTHSEWLNNATWSATEPAMQPVPSEHFFEENDQQAVEYDSVTLENGVIYNAE